MSQGAPSQTFSQPVVSLRPMAAGDILDSAAGLYRRHFVTLLGVYALPCVPFWVLFVLALGSLLRSGSALTSTAFTSPTTAPDIRPLYPVLAGLAAMMLALGVLIIVIEPIATGAVAYAVSEQLLGRRVTIRRAFARVRRCLGTLLLASLIRSMAVGAAFVAGYIVLVIFTIAVAAATGGAGSTFPVVVAVLLVLLLPVVFLPAAATYAYLAFTSQIIVVEGGDFAGALSRSFRLVAGSAWRVGWVLALTLILVFILTQVVQSPIEIGLAAASPRSMVEPEATPMLTGLRLALGGLFNLIVGPLAIVAATLLYLDLRVRKEGFDLQVAAEALAVSGGATCPACGGRTPVGAGFCQHCGAVLAAGTGAT